MVTRPRRKQRRKSPVEFDPYRVLKVPRGASAEEIQEAFVAETMQYHPGRLDVLGGQSTFRARRKMEEINRAYEQLMAELKQEFPE